MLVQWNYQYFCLYNLIIITLKHSITNVPIFWSCYPLMSIRGEIPRQSQYQHDNQWNKGIMILFVQEQGSLLKVSLVYSLIRKPIGSFRIFVHVMYFLIWSMSMEKNDLNYRDFINLIVVCVFVHIIVKFTFCSHFHKNYYDKKLS
jgi:hypothetical protein